MIGLQGHLIILPVPCGKYNIIQRLLQSFFFRNEWKFILLFQTNLESKARGFLPTIQLDFTWTIEMSDRQNDRFASPSDGLSNSFSTMRKAENSFTERFLQVNKISLDYKTVTDQRLVVFYQLFNWASTEPSKWSIEKMIVSQGHLNIAAVPWVQHEIIPKKIFANE